MHPAKKFPETKITSTFKSRNFFKTKSSWQKKVRNIKIFFLNAKGHTRTAARREKIIRRNKRKVIDKAVGPKRTAIVLARSELLYTHNDKLILDTIKEMYGPKIGIIKSIDGARACPIRASM